MSSGRPSPTSQDRKAPGAHAKPTLESVTQDWINEVLRQAPAAQAQPTAEASSLEWINEVLQQAPEIIVQKPRVQPPAPRKPVESVRAKPGVQQSPSSNRTSSTSCKNDRAAKRPSSPRDSAMNDPSLRVRVAAALAEQGIPITGWLRIGVLNGVVTLRGYFKTSRHKHLAIQILMLLNDVKETVDHTVIGEPPVEVVANSEDTWSGWLRKRWPSLTSVALLTFAGIGFAAQFRKSDGIPVYPVAGEVRVNGQIAPGAFLVFHPMTEDFPKDLRPKAQVASDGKFRVGTFDKQDGAPAGEYSVTIEWRPLIRHGDEVEPGPNVLPPFYGSPNTTTLRVRIAEKKNELRPFQVSAQPASHRNS